MTRTPEQKQALNDILQRGVSGADEDMMRLSLEKGAAPDLLVTSLANRGTLAQVNASLLTLALQKGADPNLLLFAGIDANCLPVVSLAVEQGKADVNCTHVPPGKTTPFTAADWAYQKFDSRVSDYLFSKGMDVNTRNKDGVTPLQRAVNDGHYNKVMHYLGHGADPMIADDTGKFPLSSLQCGSYGYGSTFEEKRGEMLKAMLKNVPDDADGPSNTGATFNAAATKEAIEVNHPIELKKKPDGASEHTKGFQL